MIEFIRRMETMEFRATFGRTRLLDRYPNARIDLHGSSIDGFLPEMRGTSEARRLHHDAQCKTLTNFVASAITGAHLS